ETMRPCCSEMDGVRAESARRMLQTLDAKYGRGVAIVERRMHWIWCQRGGIVIVKLHQRRHQCLARSLLSCKAVGLKFVPPGQPCHQGCYPKGEHRHGDKKEN